MRLLSLLPLLSLLSLALGNDGLTIQTTVGEIQGFINASSPLVRQFLGIPYAEPPIGNLRFAPPQTKSPSQETLNATTFAPSCMQQFSNTSTIYTVQVPQFLINGGQSEDCLYLNIWAPALKTESPQEVPLPVFVYIPGGGFTSGGANSIAKFPDRWIQRTQSHIVVVMNYRVNVFGFPNAKGLTDLNPGLMDQRKAVEWVRDNIASFGGDPRRITLWGQSAGGASVGLYGYAYPNDPIVTSLICDSGSANLLGSTDVAQSNFTFLAGLVGCGNYSDGEKELECMRGVDAVTIENALSNYGIAGTKPSISFTPFPDNKTAFGNTTDRAVRGLVAKIPAILGSNANEGAGFVSYTTNGPGAAALFATTESIIACPLAKEVRTRNLVGLPTYRYQYAGNFSNISPVDWMGAYHSSELPLLFGTHDQVFKGPSTAFEYNVSHTMEALWLSFASNPSGGPARWTKETGYFAWPQYEQTSSSMLLFASGETVQQLVTAERIDGNCTF
ncbi:related to triacylglycerol lipase V precursor [Phialocephala subalpina]|uniref:Carboxylic ester hydrolase n=1 Tax=Phialocephala subalpina TaxID=576137 RepID=A0A1L7XPK3_9HELO|nr:related to triacylglycerol lipase V precursor [Phialocephala subalpina]